MDNVLKKHVFMLNKVNKNFLKTIYLNNGLQH